MVDPDASSDEAETLDTTEETIDKSTAFDMLVCVY